MRSSCVIKGNRQQSFPSWVLLAGCSRGSRALGEVLQRLSDVQSKKSSTSISTENDSNRMAVCSMGTGHGDPFKRARSGMTHLLVAVDKFTKWIEARPIKKLDGPTAVRFVAIWCADTVYPIASSPTTAQILRKGHWPDTHLSKAFG